MNYSIAGLPIEPFQPFFNQSEVDLARHHIVRVRADERVPGFPCRVLLEDAMPGQTLLLLNHEYQPACTPYQGRHAIFINETAEAPRVFVDEIPQALRVRKAIALRAFDAAGMMLDAELVAGAEVEEGVLKLFANPHVVYLHAHNAARGCFAARIDRA